MSSALNVARSWPGYHGLRHIFVFGDSYSSVGYDSTCPHPTKEEPLGVEWPGTTYTEGEFAPNWVGHLVAAHRPRPDTLVFDYAVGGSRVHGVRQQIQREFLHEAGTKPKWAPWMPDDSLFVCWVGINDCLFTKHHEPGIDVLSALHQELYDSGARNFLLIDVPPIDLSPTGRTSARPRFQSWNDQLTDMATQFSEAHEDATVLIFSSYSTFSRVLADPVAHGFQEIDVKKSGGAIWSDHLHPTTRMHQILERDLVSFLISLEVSDWETVA